MNNEILNGKSLKKKWDNYAISDVIYCSKVRLLLIGQNESREWQRLKLGCVCQQSRRSCKISSFSVVFLQ